MKRIKANNSTGSFILLFIFFLASIIFMLIFLHLLSMKKNMEDQHGATQDASTKTTEVTTTTTKEPTAVNFSASLARVLSDTELTGKYNTEVGYEDARFIFKCATYNEADKSCEAGSSSMIINDGIAVNLYTFATPNYDYSLRAHDYYIIVQDDYIIISMNKTGIEPGIMKIYNRKGKSLKDIKNYISGYLSNDSVTKSQYPIYEDNKVTLHYCDKNVVHKSTIDLKNNFNTLSDEIIPDVTCY